MNVLVIKLGALGDFVQAFDPFVAIRQHHRTDRITLLTTAPFAALAERSPWFDRVLIDRRPRWWDIPAVLRLRQQLRGFGMVYDLQTSGRSSRYFRLAGRPPWSGIARGASHPHANRGRNRLHNFPRQREQLEAAGIHEFPSVALDWLTAGGPALPEPYAVLAPGCSPNRPEKRWPPASFGAVARLLAERGIRSVVVGTAGERGLAATVLEACPSALDLTGRTSLMDLGGIAARARVAVGNDTGPMHLAAVVGCPAIVLFSAASDPALAAPRGTGTSRVTVLREPDLADLPLERVAACLP